MTFVLNEAAAPGLLSLIGPWLVLAGTVLSAGVAACVALRVNRRTVFVDAVTKERAQWRADVRVAMERLAEQTPRVGSGNARFLHASRAAIRLRLNPLGGDVHELDVVLLETLRRHEHACQVEDTESALLWLRQLDAGVQLLLKGEWEKSKREAGGGWLSTSKVELDQTKEVLDRAVESFGRVSAGRMREREASATVSKHRRELRP